MDTSIVIKSKAVITHTFDEISEKVEKKLKELNIDNLVATDETVKSLKKLRAELNKDKKEHEDAIKEISKKILEPFTEIKAISDSKIITLFDSSIETLDKKISFVVDEQKKEKKSKIEAYFEELKQSKGFDWLKFENLKMDIILSKTDKYYKDQCRDFITNIENDIAVIKSMVNEIELLAEYKTNFNLSLTIKTVNERKQREQKEQVVSGSGELRPNTGFGWPPYKPKDTHAETEEKQTEQVLGPPKEVETFVYAFEVEATEEQANSLKNFLINSNITYKNLD